MRTGSEEGDEDEAEDIGSEDKMISDKGSEEDLTSPKPKTSS